MKTKKELIRELNEIIDNHFKNCPASECNCLINLAILLKIEKRKKGER